MSQDQLAEAYQAADAFVFLTERVEAGLTLNVLEALACGLPCIVSEHLPLFASKMMYTVSPRNVDSVAKLIQEIILVKCDSKQIGLPREYELNYSSAKYINLFRQGKTPSNI
jgi:glycosyltransferase involved in cell wall biosynthesis